KARLERRAARAFGLKDYGRAILALEELLEVIGENANSLHVLSVCRQRQGALDSAIAAAERGLAVDPDHLPCLKMLAEVHAARDDLKIARGYATRALSLLDARTRAPVTLLFRLRAAVDPRGSALVISPQDREWMRWARALLDAGADNNH
ncbi:MAG: hypothetical protein R3337_13765, partial [Gammaproteobacteria bacterium]|nr:hypothetical protein [Gammaproteobacteria bacterium]